jgi:hypothetical protein
LAELSCSGCGRKKTSGTRKRKQSTKKMVNFSSAKSSLLVGFAKKISNFLSVYLHIFGFYVTQIYRYTYTTNNISMSKVYTMAGFEAMISCSCGGTVRMVETIYFSLICGKIIIAFMYFP